jgi:hypothetical protein
MRRNGTHSSLDCDGLGVLAAQRSTFDRTKFTTPAFEVAKQFKRITAHELRIKHPVHKKLPSLWPRSYFAATAGDVSAETIQRYIEAQKGL